MKKGWETGENKEKKMRCWCGNTTRQMRERDVGKKWEMRGNKERQEERHYSNDLKGVCLDGCDVTRQQSMFWSERSTRTRGLFLNFTFIAGDRVRLARGFTIVSHTHTHVQTHTCWFSRCWLFCCSRRGRKEGEHWRKRKEVEGVGVREKWRRGEIVERHRGKRDWRGAWEGYWLAGGGALKKERWKRGTETSKEGVTITERKTLHDGGGDPCLSVFDYLWRLEPSNFPTPTLLPAYWLIFYWSSSLVACL